MKGILRIVVALIFIASGFVKAVDVRGFSFKLEEYFAPDVFNIGFLESNSLPIAIFVVLLELALGVMLLLKINLKKTLIALISLCVFFAFLTFYSAYFNKVTDCGCFGDAIKFTPWQSFIKDMVLLVALLILWMMYKKEEVTDSNKGSKGLFILSMFIFTMMMIWGIRKEPLIDFRDYKIGTDINAELKKINENPSVYTTIYTLKNKKTGQEITLNQDDYLNKEEYWQDGTPWEVEEGKSVSQLVKQGYVSEITKFNLLDKDLVDRKAEILQAPRAILVFTYYPKQVDAEVLQKIETQLKSEKNTVVMGVSSEPGTFKNINETIMDGTAIKTIARSNPSILILEKGKIVDKLRALDYYK